MMSRGFVLSLLTLCTLAGPLAAQGFRSGFWEKGQPPPGIVTVGEGEQLSACAAELARYLGRMTGTEVPVGSPDTVRDPVYAIGLERDLVVGGIIVQQNMPPESFINYRGIIAAADEAGLWFAVYDLLERLGCRFYFPGELGEDVPRVDRLAYDGDQKTHSPSFIHRNVWWAYGGRPQWQRDLYADWRRKAKMGGVPAAMGHNLMRIVPVAAFGQTHPEFFPLWEEGRHIPAAGEGSGWQPCTSNPEVVQLAIDAAIKYFDDNPDAYSFSLSPNDGYGWCQCEACVAQDPPEYRAQANRGKGRRMLLFANQVAEALAKRHPDKYVAWYAYAGTVEPPTDVKAHPNVVTAVAHYGWCGCNIHAIDDASCKMNPGFLPVMDGWAKVADKLFVREYFTTLVSATDIPARICGAFSLAQDMPYFERSNVIGVNSEAIPDYGAAALDFYLAGKLMWNAKEDVQALLADWYEGMYGPAAERMRGYDEGLVKACRERGCRGPYLSEADSERMRSDLLAAQALAETDKQKARIGMALEAVAFSLGMQQYLAGPTNERKDRLAAILDDVEAAHRLSVDFVSLRQQLTSRRPSLAAVVPEALRGRHLVPYSEAPLPAEAAQAAPTLRGTHAHAILLQADETLTATVKVRRLGRYLGPTAWTLLSPDGSRLAEGEASVEEASQVTCEAPEAGLYLLLTASAPNACQVTAANQYTVLVGPELHFLGATSRLHFLCAPDTAALRLTLKTDAPGETGKLSVYDPEGQLVAEGETGPERPSVSLVVPVPEPLRGKTWSLSLGRASQGTCEDLTLTMAEGTLPLLATDPSRLLVAGE